MVPSAWISIKIFAASAIKFDKTPVFKENKKKSSKNAIDFQGLLLLSFASAVVKQLAWY